MDPQSSKESATSTTDSPLVAVGRKVKSVLGTHQQPSVRIIRDPPSTRHVKATHEEPSSSAPGQSPASTSYFASLRSFFGSKDESPVERTQNDEYDEDTVDLLDVVGQYRISALWTRD